MPSLDKLKFQKYGAFAAVIPFAYATILANQTELNTVALFSLAGPTLFSALTRKKPSGSNLFSHSIMSIFAITQSKKLLPDLATIATSFFTSSNSLEKVILDHSRIRPIDLQNNPEFELNSVVSSVLGDKGSKYSVKIVEVLKNYNQNCRKKILNYAPLHWASLSDNALIEKCKKKMRYYASINGSIFGKDELLVSESLTLSFAHPSNVEVAIARARSAFEDGGADRISDFLVDTSKFSAIQSFFQPHFYTHFFHMTAAISSKFFFLQF